MPLSVRALTQELFKGWPAFVMRQNGLTLSVVPNVGGRLMGINLAGQELCFVHPELAGRTYSGDVSDWPALCGDWNFPLWGGGKTWVAPESDWPQGAPHRDLDSLPWTVKEVWCTAESMGVTVQSPICSQSGLQISRRLTLPANATAWTVEHTLANCGTEVRTCGVWDVLMLCRPGRVSVPLAPSPPTHPCGIAALPGKEPLESLMRSGTVEVSAGQARIHCVAAREFKCGFYSEEGLIHADFEDGGIRYARRSRVEPGQAYAHGHPIEVFNAPKLDYFEVETHSPLQQLSPGDCIRYLIHERVSALAGDTHPPSTLIEKETT